MRLLGLLCGFYHISGCVCQKVSSCSKSGCQAVMWLLCHFWVVVYVDSYKNVALWFLGSSSG